MEEQRKQKQKALVDNEQLRDELERLQRVKQDSDRSQRLCAEAESRCPGVPWGVPWCPGVSRGAQGPWGVLVVTVGLSPLQRKPVPPRSATPS